jgi:hypothetical protein
MKICIGGGAQADVFHCRRTGQRAAVAADFDALSRWAVVQKAIDLDEELIRIAT